MSRLTSIISEGPVRDRLRTDRDECQPDKAARSERGKPTGHANCPPSVRAYVETRITELSRRYEAGEPLDGDRFDFEDYAPALSPSSVSEAGSRSLHRSELSETDETLLAHRAEAFDEDYDDD